MKWGFTREGHRQDSHSWCTRWRYDLVIMRSIFILMRSWSCNYELFYIIMRSLIPVQYPPLGQWWNNMTLYEYQIWYSMFLWYFQRIHFLCNLLDLMGSLSVNLHEIQHYIVLLWQGMHFTLLLVKVSLMKKNAAVFCGFRFYRFYRFRFNAKKQFNIGLVWLLSTLCKLWYGVPGLSFGSAIGYKECVG